MKEYCLKLILKRFTMSKYFYNIQEKKYYYTNAACISFLNLRSDIFLERLCYHSFYFALQCTLTISCLYSSNLTGKPFSLFKSITNLSLILFTGLFLPCLIFALLHLQTVSPHLEFAPTELC